MIRVLKYGSSVLGNADRLAVVALDIYRHVRRGTRVVAVVSAYPGVTDSLFKRALLRDRTAETHNVASLVSSGERTVAAELGIELDSFGLPNRIVTPEHLELITAGGSPLAATPVSVNIARLRVALDEVPVLIVPGFSGCGIAGPTLLGRGGTDYTAIYLAAQLRASCDLVKDVPGVHPTREHSFDNSQIFNQTSWEDLVGHNRGLVQPEALAYAASHQVPFVIRPPGTLVGTRVGSEPTRHQLVRISSTGTPRLGLIGFGTVGRALYELVQTGVGPSIERVLVRKQSSERTALLGSRLTADPDEFWRSDFDILVEVAGGSRVSDYINRALGANIPVVSANKEVLATDHSLGHHHRSGRIRASASVGGVVPMIETVASLSRTTSIHRIDGILNGTCNFILDRLSQVDFPDAVREAQAAGLAETNPIRDLNGQDAACKLAILSAVAWNARPVLKDIRTHGITGVIRNDVMREKNRGRQLALVASSVAPGNTGTVRPIPLEPGSPLFGTSGPENRLVVHTEEAGSIVVRGHGAGGRPTAMAVLADIIDAAESLTSRGKFEAA